MTKTAQLAVSRGLAELTAGTGVTVNSVLPGPTRSEGVEDFLREMARQSGQTADDVAANFVKQHRSTSLLQRFATVEEVANMVVYAVSNEASATNGAALRVEGEIVPDHRLKICDAALHDLDNSQILLTSLPSFPTLKQKGMGWRDFVRRDLRFRCHRCRVLRLRARQPAERERALPRGVARGWAGRLESLDLPTIGYGKTMWDHHQLEVPDRA